MTFQLTIKTAADLEAEAQAELRAREKADARAYLASTDWLVTRLAETGKAIPANVAELRAQARATASNDD